nr:glycoside hydrolase, family 32 [Tanacetum cinerariifolium]
MSSSLNQKYYKPSFVGFVDVDLAEKKLSVTSLIAHSIVESRLSVTSLIVHSVVESRLSVTSLIGHYVVESCVFNISRKCMISWIGEAQGSLEQDWSGHRDEDAREKTNLDHINQEVKFYIHIFPLYCYRAMKMLETAVERGCLFGLLRQQLWGVFVRAAETAAEERECLFGLPKQQL